MVDERMGGFMGEHADSNRRIVFIGDSLTASGDWATWLSEADVVNLGVPGHTSDDLLARLDEIVATAPDEIVMLIGTNDLGLRRSVERVVRNVESALVHLRRELPGVRLLLQSVLPRGADFARPIQETNIHFRQFCATVGAAYLDLWPAMADREGALRSELTEDGLHLNQAGYDAWLDELIPGLDRLRGLPPMSRPLRIIDPEQPR